MSERADGSRRAKELRERGEGKWTGAGAPVQAEDRHYRNQIGIGDRGSFARFLAGRKEDETTAEEYLKTSKKPYKKKSIVAEGVKEHLASGY
jgi:hypothetical protein